MTEIAASGASRPVTVAVTGASGFIGSHLVARLAGVGHATRALRRRTRVAPSPGVTWIDGDLADGRGLEELLDGVDAVVHCAGAVRGARAEDFDVNIRGTQRIAEAVARRGTPRLLLLSSLAAREPQLSLYAASKRAGEDALRRFGIDWTILRPPAVYGPGDVELAPLFALMLRGIAVTPAHRGRFSLLYVADLIEAIVAWLAAPAATGCCLELDDGVPHGYDWDEVTATAAMVRGARVLRIPVPRWLLAVPANVNQWLGRHLHLTPMLTPGKVRELYHSDWVCRSDAVSAALDWRPRVQFAEGLRLTFAPT